MIVKLNSFFVVSSFKLIKLLFVLFLSFLSINFHAQTIIKMEKVNGVFMMPCKVNGLSLKFIFDTGASDVSISITEARFMLKNGYLKESEIGKTEYYQIANGDISEGTKIILKEIDIGNLKLFNVNASVVHSLSAPLLLGQSALNKLGKIEFDYSNNTLKILNSKSDNNFKNKINSIIVTESNKKLAENYCITGKSKYDAGDNEGAIQDYSKAIELNPTDETYYINRGRVKFRLKDYQSSIQDNTNAIELNPKNDTAYNNIGAAKLALKDFEETIQYCNKAIELNPKLGQAYNNRGAAKMYLKDYHSAIQDCNKAIELNSKLAQTYFVRGASKNALEDYYGGIQDNTKAIELDSKLSLAYCDRGFAKLKLKDFNGSLEDNNKCIELNPNHALAYNNRGVVKNNLGDKKGACLDWSKAGELGYTKAYDNISKYCK